MKKVNWLKKLWFVSFGLLLGLSATAQYAPAVGQVGTSAIHADSSVFVGWASRCDLQRGPDDISASTVVYPTAGSSASGVGKADGIDVVSLGDGGYAILEFDLPIMNGDGPDFAVFENAFDDAFLELAFVEVSSDGSHFVRFPAVSLTDASSEVGSFGILNPELIHNLAGKYRSLHGVPFDLEELKDSVGLDVGSITHVKVIDVIGTIEAAYASYDSKGNVINDPWPTNFPSGGFDLDAVGVIHSASASNTVFLNNGGGLRLYPNPADLNVNILMDNASQEFSWTIKSTQGAMVKMGINQNVVSCSDLEEGFYVLELEINGKYYYEKFVVEHH